MKKWIIFFLVTSGLIIIAALVIPNLAGKRMSETKTSLTDEQIKIIDEKLDVDYTGLSVERMEYTHYEALRKQTAKLNIMFALANLYLADRKSLTA